MIQIRHTPALADSLGSTEHEKGRNLRHIKVGRCLYPSAKRQRVPNQDSPRAGVLRTVGGVASRHFFCTRKIAPGENC